MKRKHIITLLLVFFLFSSKAFSQYAIGDHWYDNPLGFEPLKLHTSMGFIVPAALVAICLIVTEYDSELTNRLEIYNETGLSWGYKYPFTTLVRNSTGINYLLRDFMSIGVEIDEYIPSDTYNKTIGFAIVPFAKFYLINANGFRLFVESGGGLIYFVNEFPQPTGQDPRLGTQLNGATKYGIGTEIGLQDGFSLLIGIRHIHVSNGNTIGQERNPSHDSNGFYFGLSRQMP